MNLPNKITILRLILIPFFQFSVVVVALFSEAFRPCPQIILGLAYPTVAFTLISGAHYFTRGVKWYTQDRMAGPLATI